MLTKIWGGWLYRDDEVKQNKHRARIGGKIIMDILGSGFSAS